MIKNILMTMPYTYSYEKNLVVKPLSQPWLVVLKNLYDVKWAHFVHYHAKCTIKNSQKVNI